jgi:hypothetical protein
MTENISLGASGKKQGVCKFRGDVLTIGRNLSGNSWAWKSERCVYKSRTPQLQGVWLWALILTFQERIPNQAASLLPRLHIRLFQSCNVAFISASAWNMIIPHSLWIFSVHQISTGGYPFAFVQPVFTEHLLCAIHGGEPGNMDLYRIGCSFKELTIWLMRLELVILKQFSLLSRR